jgi:hypothetical protein
MTPDTAAWLASMREWAALSGAQIFPVVCRGKKIALFPEDVTTRNDEELLAFIARRLYE